MKKLILAIAIGFLVTTSIQAQSKEEGMIKDLVRIELSDKYKLSEDASYRDKTVQRAVLYGENAEAPVDGIQSQHVFELPVKGVDYQEGETYNPKNVSDALLEGIDAVYGKAGTNVNAIGINKYCIEFVTVGEKRIAIVTLVNIKDPKQRVKEMNQQLGVDPDKLTGN
jgi:hypothetical protein